VIDGSQKVRAQQFSEFPCIDTIALVTDFQQGILPRVTDQDLRDLGLEQGVQPGRAGAFFEGHMQAATQTWINARMVFAFVSRMASITALLAESDTATEIVAW
jgi:hypothetical protein